MRKNPSPFCSTPGCIKPPRARGWCYGHYHRWRTYGDPLGGGTPASAAQNFYRDVVVPYDGDECLLWPFSCNAKGYAQMSHDGKTQKVHRILCTEANGDPPTPLHHAAHNCGKGYLACVTKRHLAWKTATANEADKIVHGTAPRGSRHGASKLTETAVLRIRELAKMRVPQAAIAAQYGITTSYVGYIHRRLKWAWLA